MVHLLDAYPCRTLRPSYDQLSHDRTIPKESQMVQKIDLHPEPGQKVVFHQRTATSHRYTIITAAGDEFVVVLHPGDGFQFTPADPNKPAPGSVTINIHEVDPDYAGLTLVDDEPRPE